jgi:DNA ligase (NAD+)
MSNVAADIQNLNSQLIDAADAYYKKASPIMSDAAFDAFEKQLKQLVADHPQYASMATYLKKVGSDAKSVSGRVAHRIPMLSIENQYTEDDFLGQFDKFGGVPVCIEPKFDGISVSLTYVDGKLTKALTRGDGESGENMTAQVLLCDIPNQLPARFAYNNQMYHVPSLVEVRGELVMKNSTLEKLNAKFAASGQKTYSSTRNLTAGTMKLDPIKYADKIREREITIRPWDVIVDGVVASRYARLVMIAQAGFELPEGVIVSKRSDIIPILQKYLAANKRSDVQADGVVMKVDDVPTCRRLGLASKYTNYQTCFKPQDDKAETYVREVIWQIGRTGKLTPVAICDPVTLAGAVLTRVTINNTTWIKEQGLTIGAKVLMLRSGGVIPKIEAVIDPTGTPIVAPKTCPDCNWTLDVFTDSTVDATEHIYCLNDRCPGRVVGHFCFIGDRDVLEIDGLGPELSTMLVKGNYARNVAELVEFADETNDAITVKGEGPVTKSLQKAGFTSAVVKMAKSVQLAKHASWERWIAALGIPMVSDTLGKVIAKEMKLTSDDMVNLVTKFNDFMQLTIAGVGPSKKESLREWLKVPANVTMIASLAKSGVKPTPLAAPKNVNGPLAGLAFCITGEFGEPREAITLKLERLGATSKSGVSKNTNLLIIGSVPGGTKTKAAAKLGTKTMDEAGLRDLLAQHGEKLAGSKFAI